MHTEGQLTMETREKLRMFAVDAARTCLECRLLFVCAKIPLPNVCRVLPWKMGFCDREYVSTVSGFDASALLNTRPSPIRSPKVTAKMQQTTDV